MRFRHQEPENGRPYTSSDIRSVTGNFTIDGCPRIVRRGRAPSSQGSLRKKLSPTALCLLKSLRSQFKTLAGSPAQPGGFPGKLEQTSKRH